jgi:hypothetical protein
VHNHTALAYVCAVGLICVFTLWTLRGLRAAERAG